MHARTHRVQVGQQVLLRLDFLQAHLLEKFLLLERSLGNADTAHTTHGGAIRNEREFLHVFLGINARALQSGLELLQVVGQNAVLEGARRWRIPQRAIIDRDDLLDRRWNYGAGIAAQRRRECRQAKNDTQKKTGEELLHVHNSTRLSRERCGIVSVCRFRGCAHDVDWTRDGARDQQGHARASRYE